MLMANHGQQKLFIHAFEPGTTSFEALQKNTSHLRDLKLNHFGLGAAPAEMTLYSSEPGSALASLTKRRLDHFKRKSDDPGTTHSETVRIDTLDAYCEREMIDHIDLLKIDVEGHELDVLAGAMRMLEGGKIRYLTFEFGGCNIDTRTFFQDYWYFFKKFPTAQIFRLTPSGFLLPIRKYQETQEQFRASNFLVKF
jgi:FkbM family methyltransferase